MQAHAMAWSSAWSALGATPAAGLLQQLVAAYAQPHRHYHALHHLDACLRQLDAARSCARQADEVALALWFHDAIYQIAATDNERQSADWAHTALLQGGVAPQLAQRVHALVMVTCHTREPASDDEKLLLDIDLSILGSPAAQFDRYEDQVRREYRQVPEAQFQARRKTILEQFLARPRIYRTDIFRDRFEAPARANLRRSIDRLGAPAIN